MVERPIKKSERQSEEPADTSINKPDVKPPVQQSDVKPPVQSPSKGSERKENRSAGRGKKGDKVDESKLSVNPALARGPKPVKIQAPVTLTPETDPEVVSDEPEDEATEG